MPTFSQGKPDLIPGKTCSHYRDPVHVAGNLFSKQVVPCMPPVLPSTGLQWLRNSISVNTLPSRCGQHDIDHHSSITHHQALKPCSRKEIRKPHIITILFPYLFDLVPFSSPKTQSNPFQISFQTNKQQTVIHYCVWFDF